MAPLPTVEVGEGGSGGVMVMLAGYPDDHRVWAEMADHFKSKYRVVIACLPDFDKTDVPSRKQGWRVEEVDAALDETIARAAPGKADRVTLVIHDWGCFYGYRYLSRHPEKVSKLVAMDIGAAARSSGGKDRPLFRASVQIAKLTIYQLWFAACFVIGNVLGYGVGDAVLFLFFAIARVTGFFGPGTFSAGARPFSEIHCWQGYCYYYVWRKILFEGEKPRMPYPKDTPMLYMYGADKHLMFHSDAFLERAKSSGGMASVRPFRGGHWFYRDDHDGVVEAMEAFLEGRPVPEKYPA